MKTREEHLYLAMLYIENHDAQGLRRWVEGFR
jgi:hypothetical protein